MSDNNIQEVLDSWIDKQDDETFSNLNKEIEPFIKKIAFRNYNKWNSLYYYTIEDIINLVYTEFFNLVYSKVEKEGKIDIAYIFHSLPLRVSGSIKKNYSGYTLSVNEWSILKDIRDNYTLPLIQSDIDYLRKKYRTKEQTIVFISKIKLKSYKSLESDIKNYNKIQYPAEENEYTSINFRGKSIYLAEDFNNDINLEDINLNGVNIEKLKAILSAILMPLDYKLIWDVYFEKQKTLKEYIDIFKSKRRFNNNVKRAVNEIIYGLSIGVEKYKQLNPIPYILNNDRKWLRAHTSPWEWSIIKKYYMDQESDTESLAEEFGIGQDYFTRTKNKALNRIINEWNSPNIKSNKEGRVKTYFKNLDTKELKSLIPKLLKYRDKKNGNKGKYNNKINTSTLKNFFVSYNKRKTPILSVLEEDLLYDKYIQDLSFKECVAKYNINVKTIRRVLKEAVTKILNYTNNETRDMKGVYAKKLEYQYWVESLVKKLKKYMKDFLSDMEYDLIYDLYIDKKLNNKELQKKYFTSNEILRRVRKNAVKKLEDASKNLEEIKSGKYKFKKKKKLNFATIEGWYTVYKTVNDLKKKLPSLLTERELYVLEQLYINVDKSAINGSVSRLMKDLNLSRKTICTIRKEAVEKLIEYTK